MWQKNYSSEKNEISKPLDWYSLYINKPLTGYKGQMKD